MALSVLDLYTIGIGPSSSHSIGPMRAAGRFVARLRQRGLLAACRRVEVRLYASLALTGKGHGTDKAVVLGLAGEAPETVDPDAADALAAEIAGSGRLTLPHGPTIAFAPERDLLFLGDETLPYHPNGMRFLAYDANGRTLDDDACYSIGGGFVVDAADAARDQMTADETPLPYPYRTGEELLARARESGLAISDLTLANESAWRPTDEVRARLVSVWRAMQGAVERGCRREGVLPGGLGVRRRAPDLARRLHAQAATRDVDPLGALDWVNLYALAVSEENAAGGRVVTAPTNGAAGILPAVLHYYAKFVDGADDAGVVRMLLCAGAIGILYKLNASISGAEVGCQGEVGVACSMAAAALTEALGGTPQQVEMAAEIGMEHNLGLTCDPVGGLVQVPCIERCAMGAVKAINAAHLALRSDGTHRVSLDRVIRTMRDTGRDMLAKYKETSRGGLAVAVTEC